MGIGHQFLGWNRRYGMKIHASHYIGINSVDDLAKCKIRDLAEKVRVSEKIVSTWIENANELLSAK